MSASFLLQDAASPSGEERSENRQVFMDKLRNSELARNIPRQTIGSAFVLVILLNFFGCDDNRPTTVAVEGKVTLDGQPVSEGTITFQPSEPAEGYPSRPAVGILAADGTYRLSTFEGEDGVVPGTYEVAVVSFSGGPSPEEPDATEVWNIPKRYGIPGQSGLTASVPADHRGPLTIDFDLSK